MAFGSFSTPAAPKTVAGYQPPQALFPGLPSAGPGMVTPNTTVSMPIEGMDIEDQIAAYNFEKLKKADRKREWAEAAAANRAGRDLRPAYQHGWQTYSPQEVALRSAFNEYYGPQIAQKQHDIAMTDPGAEGQALRQRFGNVGQYPGGYLYSSGNVGGTHPERAQQIPLQGKQGGDYQRKLLDRMWRMETDPYLKAVGGGMGASAVMQGMTPGQWPLGYGRGGKKGGGSGVTLKG